LRDELNKQYEYWKTHDTYGAKNYEINRIILCGGDANLTGLSDYLEASMKIKVSHANAWMNITEMKTSVPNMSFEESLSYATVLGLALGEFLYVSKPVVNVLPDDDKKIMAKEYWKRFSILLITILAVVMFIFTLLLSPSYFFTASKEKIAEAELDYFNINNKQLTDQDLNSTINDINKKVGLLSAVKPGYYIYNDVLGILFSKKTEGVTISQVLFNQKSDKSFVIEAHGNAKDRISLRNFKSDMDLNPKVSSVELPISNFLEKTNLSFTMTIILK